MRNTRNECKICNGICDPGELRQGICLDCVNDHMMAELHRKRPLIISNFKQMEMEDFINE
jgi:hypothetical protein